MQFNLLQQINHFKIYFLSKIKKNKKIKSMFSNYISKLKNFSKLKILFIIYFFNSIKNVNGSLDENILKKQTESNNRENLNISLIESTSITKSDSFSNASTPINDYETLSSQELKIFSVIKFLFSSQNFLENIKKSENDKNGLKNILKRLIKKYEETGILKLYKYDIKYFWFTISSLFYMNNLDYNQYLKEMIDICDNNKTDIYFNTNCSLCEHSSIFLTDKNFIQIIIDDENKNLEEYLKDLDFINDESKPSKTICCEHNEINIERKIHVWGNYLIIGWIKSNKINQINKDFYIPKNIKIYNKTFKIAGFQKIMKNEKCQTLKCLDDDQNLQENKFDSLKIGEEVEEIYGIYDLRDQ